MGKGKKVERILLLMAKRSEEMVRSETDVMHEEGCEPSGEFAYVGRTTRTAEDRLSDHKKRARGGHMAKVYQHMRKRDPESFVVKVLGVVDEVIEGEAAFSELWWSMWLEAGLNSNVLGSLTLSGREVGYHAGYRARNRENANRWKREVVACECGRPYTRGHKARHFNRWRNGYPLFSLFPLGREIKMSEKELAEE